MQQTGEFSLDDGNGNRGELVFRSFDRSILSKSKYVLSGLVGGQALDIRTMDELSEFRRVSIMCALARQRVADMAKYSEAVRAGTIKRGPLSAFKPERTASRRR